MSGIDETSVIEPRLPIATLQALAIQIPDTCRRKAALKVQDWRFSDATDWAHLANEACSAKQGWVENKTGECHAGGPPPICTANHWHRDAGNAQAALRRKQADIANSRYMEIIKMACDCWAESITQTDSAKPFTKFEQSPDASPFIASCSSDEACDNSLPGSRCTAGRCQYPAIYSPYTDKAVLKASDLAKGQVLGTINGATRGALLAGVEMLNTTFSHGILDAAELLQRGALPIQIATGLLQSTSIGMFKDSYERTLHAVEQDRRDLIAAFQAAPYGSMPAETGLIKQRLSGHLSQLNDYAAGIEREQELGGNACYNVFKLSTGAVSLAGAKLLSLPDSASLPTKRAVP
jgi:hypothetical protein